MSKGANSATASLSLRLAMSTSSGNPLDVSALLLNSSGRVGGDEDMVFYNQPCHPSGAVSFDGGILIAALNRVPTTVDRIVLLASADGRPFGQLGTTTLVVSDAASGAELMQFTADQLGSETAVLMGELYRRGEDWKFRAVGQGWASGLGGVATEFGVTVDEEATAAPAPTPALGVVDLSKPPLGTVELRKSEKVSFAKTTSTITAHLRWTKNKDLDLYALYVDRNGEQGVCYYKNQGSLTSSPYICLVSGDSKRAGQETIEISRPDQVRYVLICAYSALKNGFGSFKSFGAYAEVTDHAGSTVSSGLFHKNSFAYWVAIARIDLTADLEVSIEHVETYSKASSERRPVLHPDGTFEMNKGPIEFKRRRNSG
ncbi:hypothetical protein GCM10027047_35660 [Rhodococcus aerolatus]